MHRAHTLCAMPNAPRTYPAKVIAQNVRAEMARRGRSQAELAAVLRLTQSAISRRLAAKIDFSATELAEVGKWLNLPVASLYDEESALAEGGGAA